MGKQRPGTSPVARRLSMAPARQGLGLVVPVLADNSHAPPPGDIPADWVDALGGRPAQPGQLIGTYGVGHINGTRPGGQHLVPETCPVQVWGIFMCGWCTGTFHAAVRLVPKFDQRACCLNCWEMRNRMRVVQGLPAEGRPLAFPEDYPLPDAG